MSEPRVVWIADDDLERGSFDCPDHEYPDRPYLLLAIEEDGSVRVGSKLWRLSVDGLPEFSPDDEPGAWYIGDEDESEEVFLVLLRTALSTRREGEAT